MSMHPLPRSRRGAITRQPRTGTTRYWADTDSATIHPRVCGAIGGCPGVSQRIRGGNEGEPDRQPDQRRRGSAKPRSVPAVQRDHGSGLFSSFVVAPNSLGTILHMAEHSHSSSQTAHRQALHTSRSLQCLSATAGDIACAPWHHAYHRRVLDPRKWLTGEEPAWLLLPWRARSSFLGLQQEVYVGRAGFDVAQRRLAVLPAVGHNS